MLAAVSALLLTVLLFAVRRRRATAVVRTLFVLYLIQVAIGGVIVLRLNPPLVAAVHVVIAQLIACGVWLLAAGAFDGAPGGGSAAVSGTRPRLAVVTAATLLLQIVLGTLARHPPGRSVFIVALLGHIAVAFVLMFLVPITSIRLAKRMRSLPGARNVEHCSWTALRRADRGGRSPLHRGAGAPDGGPDAPVLPGAPRRARPARDPPADGERLPRDAAGGAGRRGWHRGHAYITRPVSGNRRILPPQRRQSSCW